MVNSPETPSEPLTYEEFTTWNPTPVYNNMFLMFLSEPSTDPIIMGYRRKPYRFALIQENPELEAELTKEMTNGFLNNENRQSLMKRLEPKLYEAYLIMRKSCLEDSELFT